MTTQWYRSHSRTPLSELIECNVNGGSLRRPKRTLWNQRVVPGNDTIWPFCYDVYCRDDEYKLPTEMAAFEFQPGPPLKVRLVDASNYWFDEPAWIPSPLIESFDETLVDIPTRFNRSRPKIEVLRGIFG